MILLGVIIQLPSIPSQPFLKRGQHVVSRFLRSTVLYPSPDGDDEFPGLTLVMLGSSTMGKTPQPCSISDFGEFFFFFETYESCFFSFGMVSKLVGLKLECALDVRFQRCIGGTIFFVSHGDFFTEVHRKWNLESWSSEKWQKTILVGEICLLVTQW